MERTRYARSLKCGSLLIVLFAASACERNPFNPNDVCPAAGVTICGDAAAKAQAAAAVHDVETRLLPALPVSISRSLGPVIQDLNRALADGQVKRARELALKADFLANEAMASSTAGVASAPDLVALQLDLAYIQTLLQ